MTEQWKSYSAFALGLARTRQPGHNWKHCLIVTPFTYITNGNLSMALLSFSRLSRRSYADSYLVNHWHLSVMTWKASGKETDWRKIVASPWASASSYAYDWQTLSMIADQTEEVRRKTETNKISFLIVMSSFYQLARGGSFDDKIEFFIWNVKNFNFVFDFSVKKLHSKWSQLARFANQQFLILLWHF